MEIVYMGLLSKIFNAIFDAILSPIFKFLSSLLETVLGWLFRAVLQPLLQNVLWPIFEGVVDMIFEILAGVIYGIFSSILELVDSMQTIFNIFAGIQKVGFVEQKQYPMLEFIFRLDTIQKAVLIVTIISFVLMMMFSAVAMARSMLELDIDHLRPVSRVLSSTMKAMIRFALIPISCMFLIMMSSSLLEGIGTVFKTNETSLGRMVFIISSLDASKNAEYNISGTAKDTPVENISGTSNRNIGATREDPIRWPYYTGDKDYSNMDTVEEDFNFARFDYLIGFTASIFLVIVLAISLLSFVCRIFDVMILFVTSPFFVSTMPLDDGERFHNWTKMFVGKLFSGYGTVLGMNLYMMLCPSVMSGKLSFGSSKTSEADYLIRLIFIVGGAWAVVKSGPTITQILSEGAAMSEREASRTTTGLVMATAVDAAHLAGDVFESGKKGYQSFRERRQLQDNARQERIRKNLEKSGGSTGGSTGGLGGLGSTGGSTGGPEGLGSTGGSTRGPGGTGSIEGLRSTGGGAGELGGLRSTGSSTGGLEGNGSTRSGIDGEGRDTADRNGSSGAFTGEGAPSGEGEALGTENASGTRGSSGESSTSEESGASRESENSNEEESSSENTVSETGEMQEESRKSSLQFLGGGRHFQIYKNEEGKTRLSLDFGKLFSISRGRDGSQRINVLGFGRKVDANGNIKYYTPVMDWKKTTGTASDGKFHVSNMKFGVVQVKRTMGPDGEKGKYYLKDLLGGTVRKRYDKETGRVETLSKFGTHYAKDSSGKYVKTDRNCLFCHYEYKKDNAGNYRWSHCSFFMGEEQSYHVNKETGEISLKNWTSRKGHNIYTSEASRAKNEKKQAVEAKYNEMKQIKRTDNR